MERQASQHRKIAEGYLSLSIAKAVFMMSGFAIYFTLPRILSAAEFGNYGVIIGFLSVFNMMLVVGNIQAVSKFVSEKPFLEPVIRSAAFRAQGFIGGGISLLLFIGADIFADLFKDPSLAPFIRMGAPIPCLY
ncbi:oligosaccharide flippase family protein, partial [bacterium]|nr:oligosaccharide flippase family protein [bacterium]